MSNLTFDEKLIREHTPEPLEGHTVVVLERVGESGEKFHSVLEPGAERPRQNPFAVLFGKPNVYVAYAVDASRGRPLHFTEHVQMAESVHDFELHFSLWYRVGDPQLLVATRTSDPLKRVRQQVAEVITEEIAELPWSDLWHAFRSTSESVVARTTAELKAFARDYGITITTLRLRATFPDSALQPDREINDIRQRGRVERARAEVSQSLHAHRDLLRRVEPDSAWDAFISHASEDKPFVRSLARQLQEAGVKVWFDESVLEVGDSLLESISRGLADSTYGIVVFSPSFLAKKWPREELKGLFSKEKLGEKTILPVWYGIDATAVQEYSWMIADRVAVSSEQGVAHVVRRLLRVMFPDRVDRSTWTPYEFSVADLTAVVLPIGPWEGTALWISKYPVLNEQYRTFLEDSDPVSHEPMGQHFVRGVGEERGAWEGPFYPWRSDGFDRPDQPVTCVSYNQALHFCDWIDSQLGSAGSADLPNLDLWRFAAFGIASWPAYREDWLNGTETRHHLAASPAPIDADGKRTNAWGVSDLIGNVWEWCTNDIMTRKTGFAALQIPGKFRREPDPVVCGGGFLDDLSRISIFIRAADLHDGLSTSHSDLGFRVAGRIALNELPSGVRIHLSNLPTEDWAKGDVVLSTPNIAGGRRFSRRGY